MEVLVVATSLKLQQAGAAHATLDFVNELVRADGVNVRVLAHEYAPEALDSRVDVQLYERPAPLPGLWRLPHSYALRQLKQVVRSKNLPQVDLCYAQTLLLPLALREVHPEVPIVTHTGAVISKRELLEEQSDRHWIWTHTDAFLLDKLEKSSYQKRLWGHIVSTSLVAKQRQEHFGLPDEFFHVAPLGIDLDRFHPASNPKLREALDIPESATVLLTVGRLIRWKNVAWALDALRELNRDDVVLVVAGDGDQKEALIQRADELGVQEQVRFVGHVTDPAPYYAVGDVFLLPSFIESFGIVYAEAMACGLPAIGLRNRPPDVLSTASDVIPDGEGGYCVSSFDEFVEKISLLVQDRAARSKMGEYAARFAQSRYSRRAYVDSVLSLAETKFGLPNPLTPSNENPATVAEELKVS